MDIRKCKQFISINKKQCMKYNCVLRNLKGKKNSIFQIYERKNIKAIIVKRL